MDAATAQGYATPPDFEEDSKYPLLDLSLKDSTELWLIQWPANQPMDFGGQELSLNLHNDGQLCSFVGSSGKVYDVVSFASQEPNATVFQSSASESKVVGKISRRVSLVHYPDPNEIEKAKDNVLKEKFQRSSGMSLTHSYNHFSTPTRSSSKPTKSSMSASRTHGSRLKSQAGSKKRHAEPSRSVAHSGGQDSGRGQSGITSTGSHSQGKSTHTSSGSMNNSRKKKKMKTHE